MVRPALLWSIALDANGETTRARVERALVRSRAQLDYVGAQRALDSGTAGESLALLRDVGRLRRQREVERGGVSLPLPEQEVDVDGERWRLRFRSPQPVEEWNAQISLLTGMAAAAMMVQARVGLLRVLPPPVPRDVDRLRRTARALGLDWPAAQSYPDFVRTLDPGRPVEAAMVVACTRLLRGSGYVGFDGDLPERVTHAALASSYAHVTAPLRRLVDRYAGEVCLTLCAGTAVPDWVRTQLPGLPEVMQESSRRARRYERSVLDAVEAGLLRGRVGETFTGVVVDLDDEDEHRGTVVVGEPAIEATVTATAPLPLGEQVRVRLVRADVAARTVEFALA